MTSDIWYRYLHRLSRVQIMKKYSALSSLGSVIVHTVKIDCLMLGNIIGDLTYTNDLCLAGYDVFLNSTRDWWNVFTKNTIDWSLIYPSSSSWRVRGFSTIFHFSSTSFNLYRNSHSFLGLGAGSNSQNSMELSNKVRWLWNFDHSQID